jgi:hypothetical protein
MTCIDYFAKHTSTFCPPSAGKPILTARAGTSEAFCLAFSFTLPLKVSFLFARQRAPTKIGATFKQCRQSGQKIS